MEFVGFGFGFLIGLVSGAVAALMLWTAAEGTRAVSKMREIAAELVAIAAFWGGGTWASGQILGSIQWSAALPAYVLALSVTFGAITIGPLIALVRRVIRELGG